jgi:hypothetical protein
MAKKGASLLRYREDEFEMACPTFNREESPSSGALPAVLSRVGEISILSCTQKSEYFLAGKMKEEIMEVDFLNTLSVTRRLNGKCFSSR